MANKRKREQDPALLAWQEGVGRVRAHPLFAPLTFRSNVMRRKDDSLVGRDQWAIVTNNGSIHCHARRRAEASEWAYVLAHCLLHLGFNHFHEHRDQHAWNLACDLTCARFLDSIKFGTPPPEYRLDLPAISAREEARAYEQIIQLGVPSDYRPDMVFEKRWRSREPDWEAALAAGLSAAVTASLQTAAGERKTIYGPLPDSHPAERARRWFMASFPLLGALAASFKVVCDNIEATRHDVDVAAVSYSERTIWINPMAALSEEEMRFVMAHELLHVGLRHGARAGGRDHLLWNVATDYSINMWLVEMGVGQMPQMGLLYDPTLKGLSSEEIYDRIVGDARRYRKLAKKRGTNLGDFQADDEWWGSDDGVSLDDFVRRALANGVELHNEQGRGLLPSGLEEEIAAQAQPPIAWDVELAQWFDNYFAPIETRRTYARPSRRQAATPSIPRPSVVPVDGAADGRTFGVVLDTSGSMDRVQLGRGLGAIASYCLSREVPRARVVFCDAAAYDAGYLSPEEIGDRIKVKGRGGTVLQPGVDLIEKAEDFPKDGPILIITDAECDHVRPNRDHAYLIPRGARLPFPARGPVFEMPKSQAEERW